MRRSRQPFPDRSTTWLFAIGLFALSATASAQTGSELVVDGLIQPLYATHAPGRPHDLFIVERAGDIKILDLTTNTINAVPFLSISDVDTTIEGGLSSIAFHPDFANNGLFYTMSTTAGTAGAALTSQIREYSASTDPDVADPAFTTVLRFSQPQANHNGGWIGFSPIESQANLYVTTGDGGGSDDNDTGHTVGIGNAQDITDNLLGKVLRIDVDGDDFPADTNRNYAIPASNPFVGVTGDDEIWAFGLRNPFRASFDRMTGDFFVGDVGQNAREEIDYQPASSMGGENYGWRLREGTIATPSGGVGGNLPVGAIDPIYEYTHGGGNFQGSAVTGGYLFRGPIDDLYGRYVFGDYVSGNIWAFDPDDPDPDETITRLNNLLIPDEGSIANVAGFGEDAAGNLYLLDLDDGEIFRVVPEPATASLVLAGVAGLTALVRVRRWEWSSKHSRRACPHVRRCTAESARSARS